MIAAFYFSLSIVLSVVLAITVFYYRAEVKRNEQRAEYYHESYFRLKKIHTDTADNFSTMCGINMEVIQERNRFARLAVSRKEKYRALKLRHRHVRIELNTVLADRTRIFNQLTESEREANKLQNTLTAIRRYVNLNALPTNTTPTTVVNINNTD